MSFDPRPYIDGLKRANQREAAATQEPSREALKEAQRLADRIAAGDESVRAVHLFGSLAEGVPSNLHVDIDIAIDGGNIYRAMEIAEDSSFSVDFVELRLLPDFVRREIESAGRVHEATGGLIRWTHGL